MRLCEECVQRFRASESGQGLVEYAFILAIVSTAAILVLTDLGASLDEMFQGVLDLWP